MASAQVEAPPLSAASSKRTTADRIRRRDLLRDNATIIDCIIRRNDVARWTYYDASLWRMAVVVSTVTETQDCHQLHCHQQPRSCHRAGGRARCVAEGICSGGRIDPQLHRCLHNYAEDNYYDLGLLAVEYTARRYGSTTALSADNGHEELSWKPAPSATATSKTDGAAWATSTRILSSLTTSADNYRLSPGSPCIDAGDNNVFHPARRARPITTATRASSMIQMR